MYYSKQNYGKSLKRINGNSSEALKKVPEKEESKDKRV